MLVKLIKFLTFTFIILFILGANTAMANSSNVKSIKVDLGTSTYSEFVDFLYEYSTTNRLNIQWFGWYYKTDANKWYERSDKKSNFKVNMQLLSDKNGYLYFSNGFDEKTINFIIDYGDKKVAWLSIIKDFNKKLNDKGWLLVEKHDI